MTDLNYGRHLGHQEMIGFLHQARVEFLAAHDMTEMQVGGTNLLVVDLAVVYRQEVLRGRRLAVDIGLSSEGSRGLGFDYEVRDVETGRQVALARVGAVFADPETRRVVQVPEALRELVQGGVDV